MSPSKLDPGVLEAQQARAELYETLGQLRERLDYAHRIDVATSRAKARIIDLKTRKPVVFAIGVASVAAAVGLTVWGVARAISRACD